jgi:hypothetical protein
MNPFNTQPYNKSRKNNLNPLLAHWQKRQLLGTLKDKITG